MKLIPIEGNRQKLDGGSMFGNVPRPVWSQWTAADEQGRITLSCRCLLLQIEGQNILFETGIGNFFEPKMADRFGVQNPTQHMLLENLRAQGIRPEQIDWVILSHLHFDHAGGLLPGYLDLTQGQQGLVFPNAKIVIGSEAWERALNPHPRDRASFIPELMKRLGNNSKVHVIKPDQRPDQLPDAIHFFYSNGHTPGQMHSYITYKDSVFVFTGDLIPGAPWVHLPITMGYDRFPEQLIDEKAGLYQRFADKDLWLFFTHDIQNAWGKVSQNEKGHYVALEQNSNSFELNS